MVIEEIDRVLSLWRRDLASIESNILELNGLLSYEILSSGSIRFTGRSTVEVPQAIAAVELLWELLRLVQEVIARATQLRASLPFLKRAQALAEIEQLLTGPSVVMPAQEVPLAQRGLLSESESLSRFSPEQAKKSMVRLFEKARAVFVAIDARWAEAHEQLDAQRQRAQELAQQVKRLTQREVRESVRLLAVLDTLEDQTRTDPLGFSSPEEFLRPFFKEARSALAELQHEHGSRSQRREELAQHTARAEKLAERARAAGAASCVEVTRLLGALQDLERRLHAEPALLGVNLDELLRPLFRQARDAVQALEASQTKAAALRSGLAVHRERLDVLSRQAKGAAAPIPALKKLSDTLAALEGEFERDPGRFSDPAEFLEPFFVKAKQALDGLAQPGEQAHAALARAKTQAEKLLGLYAEAQQLLEATRRLGLAIALPELPPPLSVAQRLARAEAACANASWELVHQETAAISAEYGQALGPLRAMLAAGGSVVTPLLALEQKIKEARALIAAHNLQEDKPSKAYLSKLETLLGPNAGASDADALVDKVARLVYSLETRLGELILSSH